MLQEYALNHKVKLWIRLSDQYGHTLRKPGNWGFPEQSISMAKKTTLPKLGSKMYAIHKKYIEETTNGRMIVATVRTYERYNGTVRPVLTPVGYPKQELSHDTHHIFDDVDKCVKLMMKGVKHES